MCVCVCVCVNSSILTSSVGLWDSQNSVDHEEGPRYAFFVKNKAKDLCKDKIWSFFMYFGSLFCDMSTNSFI